MPPTQRPPRPQLPLRTNTPYHWPPPYRWQLCPHNHPLIISLVQIISHIMYLALFLKLVIRKHMLLKAVEDDWKRPCLSLGPEDLESLINHPSPRVWGLDRVSIHILQHLSFLLTVSNRSSARDTSSWTTLACRPWNRAPPGG